MAEGFLEVVVANNTNRYLMWTQKNKCIFISRKIHLYFTWMCISLFSKFDFAYKNGWDFQFCYCLFACYTATSKTVRTGATVWIAFSTNTIIYGGH